jgi:hypothetical protein
VKFHDARDILRGLLDRCEVAGPAGVGCLLELFVFGESPPQPIAIAERPTARLWQAS